MSSSLGSSDSRFRQSQANQLFLAAYTVPVSPDGRGQLVAYVCSTQSSEDSLTHSSMYRHVPDGPSVCIHSVCVSPEYRRKGVALALLREYISRLTSDQDAPYERVLLLTHKELIPFYTKAGFHLVSLSSIEHGSRPWYEMRMFLRTQSISEPSSTAPALGPNKYPLTCSRPGCGSIIVRANVANMVQRPLVQMEPLGTTSDPLLPHISAENGMSLWWLVAPSPMEFENIAFSHAVDNAILPGLKLKLLACAECDLGPIGWCEEGGTEFFLSPIRVRNLI
ncbi:acyl-CoA N-acyltransferase [Mycena floridula]|nr:acyl-CoA N-acyltransferase [Mycena floridula]